MKERKTGKTSIFDLNLCHSIVGNIRIAAAVRRRFLVKTTVFSPIKHSNKDHLKEIKRTVMETEVVACEISNTSPNVTWSKGSVITFTIF